MTIMKGMLYVLRMMLFFAMLWMRPLVHLPLRLLSYLSLIAFAVTLMIPHPMPLYSRLLMVSVGIGALILTWVYDSLLGLMSG